MSDKILGNATYKCSNCGAKHYLRPDDFYFESESGSERGMGTETQYVAEFDEPCHKCANPIDLKFYVWEYPTGVINYTDEESSGAEVIDSGFNIYNAPPEESYHEAIELIKSLLSFRFDKFSELFVDIWISNYKKAPKPTTIISIIGIVLGITSIGMSIHQAEKKRSAIFQEAHNYKDQYKILKETEDNLDHLARFISSKKAEIQTTQELIENLEKKKSELEPIVNARQEVIDAIFLQQRKQLEEGIWVERGISFLLGILASLIASLIWHFVSRLRKRSEKNII
ncbi:hypothetical protein E0765_05555 [Sulfuricurvum sp. IAE1]|uniref:hypothetical protein n=1 Tax=Sulfuricurvum sp. IAE1 TaxID=2546102 RepID=UPI00104B81DF|nr:hypothetical protein [Sulfuricurvum sp. IAE1]TDA64177.1 hypothetical protein E0765_05555 [Sulfuricurvum sp. IAE1]